MTVENKERRVIILTFDDGEEEKIHFEMDNDKDFDNAHDFYITIENQTNVFLEHPYKWVSYNISKIRKIRMEGFTSEKVETTYAGKETLEDYWSWKTVKKD